MLTINELEIPGIAIPSTDIYRDDAEVASRLPELYVSMLGSEDEELPSMLLLSAKAGMVSTETGQQEIRWVIPYEGIADTAEGLLGMARLFFGGVMLGVFPEQAAEATLIGHHVAALMELLAEMQPRMLSILDEETPHVAFVNEDLAALLGYEPVAGDEQAFLLHLRSDVPVEGRIVGEEEPKTDNTEDEALRARMEDFCGWFNREHSLTRVSVSTEAPALFEAEGAKLYLTLHSCLPESGGLWPENLYEAWIAAIEEDLADLEQGLSIAQGG